MKKITALLIFILIFTAIAGTAVVASATDFSDSVEFQLDRDNENLTIGGITSSKRGNVPVSIMLLLPPDNGETNLDSSKEERDAAFNAKLAELIQNPALMDSVVSYFYETKTEYDEEVNGVFSHSFKLGGNGGLYRLVIRTNDNDSFSKDFYFFPKAYYERIVQNINKADSSINDDNNSVKYYLENDIRLQDIFYDLYTILLENGVSTDRVYTAIYNRKNETKFASFNELESYIKKQIATCALQSGNVIVFDEVLSKKAYTDILKLTWGSGKDAGELASFKNFKDETKTDSSDKLRIIEYLASSTGESDYEFASAVFMNEYSRLTLWSQIKPLIENYYDSILGINYDKYIGLSNTYPVDTALIGDTDVIVYNRFEDFKKKFNNLLSEGQSSGGGTSGGGSSSGSGTGGGGGGSSSGSGTGGSSSEIGISVDHQVKEEISNNSIKFYDLENVKWAEEAIYALSGKGIVSGTGNGCFNPSDYVTREQFVTMIVRLYDLKAEKNSVDFLDTKSDAWYYSYIAAGIQNGIINGVGNGVFGVGSYISRQDMAVIASRVLKLYSKETSTDVQKTFSDIQLVSDYAKDAVKDIAALGIINGYEDNSFRPYGYSTRAEAAKIIYGLSLIK